jgi:hypothetical protein
MESFLEKVFGWITGLLDNRLDRLEKLVDQNVTDLQTIKTEIDAFNTNLAAYITAVDAKISALEAQVAAGADNPGVATAIADVKTSVAAFPTLTVPS